MGLSYEKGYPLAASAASKALALDNDLAEAHLAQAQVSLRFLWDWNKAEAEYRRAIELGPSNPVIHCAYGNYLVYMGRFKEAFAAYQQSLKLDPINPLTNFYVGWAYGKARRYDEAISHLRGLLEIDPNWGLARYEFVHAYARQGMFREAVAEAEKTECWEPGGWAYAVSGKQTEARAIISKLIQESKHGYVDPGYIALTYASLGEREKALQWLEKGYRTRSRWMIYLKVTPEVDSLRSDPYFQDILRRMNFPP